LQEEISEYSDALGTVPQDRLEGELWTRHEGVLRGASLAILRATQYVNVLACRIEPEHAMISRVYAE